MKHLKTFERLDEEEKEFRKRSFVKYDENIIEKIESIYEKIKKL